MILAIAKGHTSWQQFKLLCPNVALECWSKRILLSRPTDPAQQMDPQDAKGIISCITSKNHYPLSSMNIRKNPHIVALHNWLGNITFDRWIQRCKSKSLCCRQWTSTATAAPMNSIAASVKVRRKAPVISSSSARATAPTRPATSRICHRENGIMMPLPTKESVCFKWPTPIDVSMSLVKAVFSSLSASKSKN